MKTLEIIHLRLAGDRPESLVDVIRKSVDSRSDPSDVRIYRHSRIESDLVIHLHRNTEGGDARSSELGARLASVLRDYGMVEHSLWRELE
jgi:hypothetical protein